MYVMPLHFSYDDATSCTTSHPAHRKTTGSGFTACDGSMDDGTVRWSPGKHVNLFKLYLAHSASRSDFTRSR